MKQSFIVFLSGLPENEWEAGGQVLECCVSMMFGAVALEAVLCIWRERGKLLLKDVTTCDVTFTPGCAIHWYVYLHQKKFGIYSINIVIVNCIEISLGNKLL